MDCWVLSMKQLPAAAKNDTMRLLRVKKSNKAAAGQLNDEMKFTIKLCKVEMMTDNSL